MSLCKTFGLAIFAALCLLDETAGSAHAQCAIVECATEWSGGSVIDLGGLPGSFQTVANSINDAGQAVGYSATTGGTFATEWSHGKVIDLGGLPGSTFSIAYGINDAGQAVGYSETASPPSGATAKSSTWEACRAPRLAVPSASTTSGRRWRELR